MPTLKVKPTLIKKWYQLDIFHDETLIGQYERSQQQDIERKAREVSLASNLLLNVYRKHGVFKVYWDGANHKKSIRVDGVEVDSIPKKYWQKPSWA